MLRPANPQEFAEVWSKRYSYRNGHLYDNNIGKKLTEERVWELFIWKNGTKISTKKRQSIENIYLPALKQLPKFTTTDEGRRYLQDLPGGPIWGIFWLHCMNPRMFPIFDQHTYRAMASIDHLEPKEMNEIRGGRDQIKATYFDKFIPFVCHFGVGDHRLLDKALFAFGKSLKGRERRSTSCLS